MRRVFSTIILQLLLGCSTSSSVEKAPPPKPAPPPEAKPKTGTAPNAPVPLAEYLKVRRVARNGASFSFDEKWVAYSSDEGGRIDVWVAPVAGGPPKQITKVSGFVHGYRFSPTSDQLVFAADEGGNELAHLYLTNGKGDTPKDITAGDPKNARADLIDWAEDGKSFLYLSSRRDEKYLDLYSYDVKSGKSQLLWTSSGKIAFDLASKNQKRFIVTETVSDVDTNLYLVERGKKGAPVLLTPHKGEVKYSPQSFSKDTKTLFYTSDEGGEFSALRSMALQTKKSQDVLKENWDVEEGFYSRGWKYFVTVTNEDGSPKVAIADAKTHKKIDVPGIPAGAFAPLAFSKSDRYFAARLFNESIPHTLVIVDLKEGRSFQPVEVRPESLRQREFVGAKSVRITSFDEKQVPAFLFSPPGDGPFPAVIDVHGGPTSQSLRQFDALRQYLISKGYVILVPNVRGSTGYGKSYTKLDNLDLGGGPLQDVIACKRWLAKEAKVDPNRVAIMGGSYGGYMTLAAATFAPTEFAAHVDYFGVSDLKSLVESFPPYWQAFATFIYQKFGDPKNPEHAKYQHDRSPLNFVDKIERPLLVIQGDNDARVKKDQSDRIVEQLKQRKVPVHYVVITGEGHGFSKNESRLIAYTAADRFLDRYLFNDPSVPPPEEQAPPAEVSAASPH